MLLIWRSGVWLKAVSHEVMSFQSVSKSLVQTTLPTWDTVSSPPTPIKKKKEEKKNQMIRRRCFVSNTSTELCAVLCSNWARWYPAQSQRPRKDALISFWTWTMTTTHPTQIFWVSPVLWWWYPFGNNLELVRLSFPEKKYFMINIFHSHRKASFTCRT